MTIKKSEAPKKSDLKRFKKILEDKRVDIEDFYGLDEALAIIQAARDAYDRGEGR